MYSLELGVFMYKYSTNDLPNNLMTILQNVQIFTVTRQDMLMISIQLKTKNTFLITPSERVAQFFGTI